MFVCTCVFVDACVYVCVSYEFLCFCVCVCVCVYTCVRMCVYVCVSYECLCVCVCVYVCVCVSAYCIHKRMVVQRWCVRMRHITHMNTYVCVRTRGRVCVCSEYVWVGGCVYAPAYAFKSERWCNTVVHKCAILLI